MADVFDAEKRSEIMSRVKSRGNLSTEVRLLNIFRERRISGWRRHFALLGNPDFVFPKQRLAVFVDGCFWHGCRSHGTIPATNSAFWREKLTRNRNRDRFVNRELKRRGWQILRVWQHELRDPKKVTRRVVRCLDYDL
ncbi:MAG: very short patch repair endonuclease [Acidobacteriota bacterium]